MTEIIPPTSKNLSDVARPCSQSTFFLEGQSRRSQKTLLIFPALFSYLGFLSRSISPTQLEPFRVFPDSFRSIPIRNLEKDETQTDQKNEYSIIQLKVLDEVTTSGFRRNLIFFTLSGFMKREDETDEEPKQSTAIKGGHQPTGFDFFPFFFVSFQFQRKTIPRIFDFSLSLSLSPSLI